MDKKDNIIDLMERRREQLKEKGQNRENESASIVDITELRKEAVQQERRQARRTILTEFVGVFIVLPQLGLQKVSLYDISEKGVAFDLDTKGYQLGVGEEVAVRVYLSQNTYFPFTVRVKYSRAADGKNMVRHGAHFVEGTYNVPALHHFVKFVESVSKSIHWDNGDMIAPTSKK